MVRNIVVFGGSSHPELSETICSNLGVPKANIFLGKFAVGETQVKIGESVRGKDVFIIQSGGGKVNDHLMELLITISACKTASARRVTAVLPLFPYSRQSDIPYNKTGAPLTKVGNASGRNDHFTFESRPETPYPEKLDNKWVGNSQDYLNRQLVNLQMNDRRNGVTPPKHDELQKRRSDTMDSTKSDKGDPLPPTSNGVHIDKGQINGVSYNPTSDFTPQRGYKQWVAQAGTLVADLLTCAGADHVITMDLHDPQYQGFFDIPVDNLYGRHVIKNYIQYKVPNYQHSIIVSPDAGGAKRATAIADALGVSFALIHKERRPTKITDRQNATMMLVGDVTDRTAILIDDLADTSNTITRAAKLLKKEGATRVIALVTHGILSGDAIERINASPLDKLIVTNSVDQREHKRQCPKLEVLEVGQIFAEAIRRVHHGESISVLFQKE